MRGCKLRKVLVLFFALFVYFHLKNHKSEIKTLCFCCIFWILREASEKGFYLVKETAKVEEQLDLTEMENSFHLKRVNKQEPENSGKLFHKINDAWNIFSFKRFLGKISQEFWNCHFWNHGNLSQKFLRNILTCLCRIVNNIILT